MEVEGGLLKGCTFAEGAERGGRSGGGSEGIWGFLNPLLFDSPFIRHSSRPPLFSSHPSFANLFGNACVTPPELVHRMCLTDTDTHNRNGRRNSRASKSLSYPGIPLQYPSKNRPCLATPNLSLKHFPAMAISSILPLRHQHYSHSKRALQLLPSRVNTTVQHILPRIRHLRPTKRPRSSKVSQ
jgi:hypothetical protein